VNEEEEAGGTASVTGEVARCFGDGGDLRFGTPARGVNTGIFISTEVRFFIFGVVTGLGLPGL